MQAHFADVPPLANPMAVTALASMALAVAIWFLYRGIGGRGLPGCGPTSGCEAVTRSRWARCGRVPVAGLGSLVYILTCIASLSANASGSPELRRAGWLTLLALVPILAGGAVWFIGLQWLVIRRICRWCMVAHFLALLASVCIIHALGESQASGAFVIWQHWALLIPGTVALALLIALQIKIEPRTYAVVRHTGKMSPVRPSPPPPRQEPVDTPATADLEAERNAKPTLAANPFAGRTVTAAEGRIILRGDAWPVLGSPKAPHVLIYLFDYTCKECRYVHSLLDQAMQRYPLELAVMMIPVPRDPLCNPMIKTREKEHAFACAYARLGLMVWRADRSKYAEFDLYMFKSPHAPLLGQARVKAVEWVGAAITNPEAPHEEIDAVIGKAVELFKSAGTNIAPTLLLPDRAVTGRPPTADHLFRVLEQCLKLEPQQGA